MNKLLLIALILLQILQPIASISSLPNQSKFKGALKLEKSHLGRALLSMIQLGNSVSYDYQDLFDALEDLKNSLKEQKQFEKDAYDRESQQHDVVVVQLESTLKGLQDQVTEQTINLNQKLDSQENVQQNLNFQNSFVLETEKRIENLNQVIDEHNQRYAVDKADFTEAVEALESAIKLLRQAQQHYENSQFAELAQVQKQYQSMVQKMNSSIKNLSKEYVLMIKPSLQVLSELSVQTEVSTIQFAIKALVDVLDYINQGFILLNSSYESKHKSLSSDLESQQAILTNLQENVIPQIKLQLEQLEKEIQAIVELIDSLNTQIQSAQDSLDQENKAWEDRTLRNKNLLHQFNEELEIVNQAIRVLREAYDRNH